MGTFYAAVGAGPAPYNLPGKVYLAGPYKGAPLSLALVTPAVAGPFDLGNVITRVAVGIDPLDATITAKADPIIKILGGIPIDVRSASIRLDKPEFALNPSSCDPTEVRARCSASRAARHSSAIASSSPSAAVSSSSRRWALKISSGKRRARTRPSR